MSDSDNPLSERFEGHAPDSSDDETNETNNSYDTGDTDNASGSNETPDTSHSHESGGANDTVRERKQEAMYLRPEQREALRDFYEELDARSKLAGNGGLTKNDDFYEAFVTFVIDEHREEFKQYLGLDDIE